MTEVTAPVQEMINLLKDDLQPYSDHVFTARWCQEQISSLCQQPPEGRLVFVENFAKNYTCVSQDEPQSAHWHYEQVTICPIVNYRILDCGEILRDEFVVLSSDLTHDHIAASQFNEKVEQELKNVGFTWSKKTSISDGCGRQYKCCSVFNHLEEGEERIYFGSNHGKNICDRVTSVVKKSMKEAVISRKVVITGAQSAFSYCNDNLARKPECGKEGHFQRRFLLVDVDRKPVVKKKYKPVQGTRQFHYVVGGESQNFQSSKENFNEENIFIKSTDNTTPEYL
jgi:hypothetical protein